MIKIGRYQICLFDLLTDGRTGRLSASKVWLHVANIIMSKVMLTQEVTWELMAVYGAVVGGSYVAINLFKWRFRDTGQPQNGSSGDGEPDIGIRTAQPKRKLDGAETPDGIG